ncbi:MAG: hypothetical protein ACM3Z4_15300 [Hyphomicrobiales bacterium]
MDGTARFIRRENVKHYRLLLDTVTDEAERQKILKLLAEEREKQRAAGDPIEDQIGFAIPPTTAP